MDLTGRRRIENYEDLGRASPEDIFGRNWENRNPMEFLTPDSNRAPGGFTVDHFDPSFMEGDPRNMIDPFLLRAWEMEQLRQNPPPNPFLNQDGLRGRSQ